MGKFDGVLFCSDWDGTLFIGDKVPENTIKAIDYFKSEGGHFSITSGRGSSYLKEMSHFVMPNTYCICYGGALVTDIFTGETILKDFVDRDAFDVVDALLATGAKTASINLMYENEEIIRYNEQEYLRVKDRIEGNIYKVTLSAASGEDGEIYAKAARNMQNEKYTLARSFTSYIEIMKSKNTKGNSARLLKEKLDSKLLLGIGDYENDLPLFEKVDVSFAVSNAVPELKRAANYTLSKSVSEGAIEEAIAILEEKIL